jgi:DMSO/TMAO reductase YedYZ molybdopterin-dependent catalytic subunit
MIDRRPTLRLSEEEAQVKLRRLTRRGFLAGGVAAAAAVGGFEWLRHSGQIGDVPWPQRAVLNFNGSLAKNALLSGSHLARTFRPDQIGKLKANGELGMDDDDELKTWKLTLDPGAGVDPIDLQVGDVQSLPRRQMITNLCCIEGWNAVAQWTGVRFSDFLSKYLPAGQPLSNYVYMSTPDEEYYVGLDMKSVMHPQTLLAWELNGEALTPEHGAPLRLVMPVKYGIKNIKRIGTIRLTDKRPADYWAENGYDWFAGL